MSPTNDPERVSCWRVASHDVNMHTHSGEEILLLPHIQIPHEEMDGWMDPAAWDEEWASSQDSNQIESDRKLAFAIAAVEKFRASAASTRPEAAGPGQSKWRSVWVRHTIHRRTRLVQVDWAILIKNVRNQVFLW